MLGLDLTSGLLCRDLIAALGMEIELCLDLTSGLRCLEITATLGMEIERWVKI